MTSVWYDNQELQITGIGHAREAVYLEPLWDSPNLNLIERFWKFLKRKVARNRYYATFAEFRTAVQNVLNNIAAYNDELASLLTERFQLFTAS
jgi:hypothetical protein